MRMQRGKWVERESMEEAVIGALPLGRAESVSERGESGGEKDLERWVRIGVRRSSSSRPGRARAVR